MVFSAVLIEAVVIVPVDPFTGRDLDLFEVVPGLVWFDQLSLIWPVDALFQGVMVIIADRADAGFGPHFSQMLGER